MDHCLYFYTPVPPEGDILFYLCPSFRPSVLPKIFFVAFFSANIDGRNLIFGHKLHIGMPYCGKRFWTRQIPTSCLPTYYLLFFVWPLHCLSFELRLLFGISFLPISIFTDLKAYGTWFVIYNLLTFGLHHEII